MKINTKSNPLLRISLLTIVFVFVLFISFFTIHNPQAHALTFTATSTLDTSDASAGDGVCLTAGGVCTLRAAIQEVNARTGGDTINITATGTITIGSCYGTITAATTTITGPGPNDLTINATACAGSPVIDIAASYVSISGIRMINVSRAIDFSPNSSSIIYDTVNNIAVDTCSDSCIYINGSATPGGNTISHATISSSTFSNQTGGSVIACYNGFHHLTIASSTFSNTGGIGMAGSSINANMSEGHNTIENNTFANISHSVIYIQDDNDSNTISGNTIYSNYERGIDIRLGSDSNIIQNNLIGSSTWDAIGIFDVSGTTLSGNTATSTVTGGTGIHLKFATSTIMTNNITNSNSGQGIFIEGGSDGTTIASSTASLNSQRGIYIANASNIAISSSTVLSNTNEGIYLDRTNNINISNSTTNSNSVGVTLANATSTTISYLTSASNVYQGIKLDPADNCIISTSTLSSNPIGITLNPGSDNNTINGNTANSGTYYGIQLVTATNNIINGNITNSNGIDGINIDSNSATSTIQNNTANSNTQYGIYFAGSGHTVSGNTVTGTVGQVGLYCNGCYYSTIQNNNANSNLNNGIQVNGGNNIQIIGNTTNYNDENAIIITGDASTNNINIEDNTTSYNTGWGVSLMAGVNNTTITGNTISYNISDGISLFSYLGYNPDSNIITNNTIYYNSDGIEVTSANNTISSNTIYGNNHHGINSSASTAYGNQITSNTIYGHGTTTSSSWIAAVSPLKYGSTSYNEEYTGTCGSNPAIGYYEAGNDTWTMICSTVNTTVPTTNEAEAATVNAIDALVITLDVGGGPKKMTGFSKAGIFSDLATIDGILVGAGIGSAEAFIHNIMTKSGGVWTYNGIVDGVNGVTVETDNEVVTLVGSEPSLTYGSLGYAYSAISLSSATSTTISFNTIYNNGNGITFAGASSGNTVDSGSITTSLGYDIQSSASGTNTLDNLSFDLTKTNITAGQIDVYYDIKAQILDSMAIPLTDVSCSVQDTNSNTTSLGLTTSGLTGYASVNAFNLNSSGYQTNNNPYNLSCSKPGYRSSDTPATINQQNQTINLSLSTLESSSSPPPLSAPFTWDNTNNDNNTDNNNSSNNNNQNNNNQNNGSGNNSTSTDQFITHPSGTLIRYQNSPKVYLIQDNQKHWIPTADIFNQLGLSWNNIVIILDQETYPDGPDVTSPTNSSNTTNSSLIPSSFQFTKFLSRGSQGQEVKYLQIKLQELGFFPQTIQPNGVFGPTTLQAVKAFQKAHGISPVGYVGPGTRSALNER